MSEPNDHLESVLLPLLACAAQKDALRVWPRHVAIDEVLARAPTVEARRDEDGTLGVFRFFDIVAPADTHATALTAVQAKERIEALRGQHVHRGDVVGVELPLARMCAIALADVDSRNDVLLPQALATALADDALREALVARLSSLRGTPPHVPLRQLITDHGDEQVLWTAVTPDTPSGSSELLCLVAHADTYELAVVPAATSNHSLTVLLQTLRKPPSNDSLWRYFEAHAADLLGGEGRALFSDVDASRKLSIEFSDVAISTEVGVFGVFCAKVLLLTWVDDKIINEVRDTVAFPLDVARAFFLPWPDAAVAGRLQTEAAQWRALLCERLQARAHEQQPALVDIVGDIAMFRALARVADSTPPWATPPTSNVLRASEGPDVHDPLRLRFGDTVVSFSPGEDSIVYCASPDTMTWYADGQVAGGDIDGFRALVRVWVDALVQSPCDVELAFDDDGNAPTVLLSSWLMQLSQRTPLGCLSRREGAFTLFACIDRLADRGPTLHNKRTKAAQRQQPMLLSAEGIVAHTVSHALSSGAPRGRGGQA